MEKRKILLGLLSYWTPLIPPLGISCLKAFLKGCGYKIKTFDTNIIKEFRRIYDTYFDQLKEFIPGYARGNFYSVGHDVMRNHMMAHLHYTNENEYIALVKILVFETYFCPIDDFQVYKLVEIVGKFYQQLELYLLELVEQENPGVLGLSVYSDTLPASLFAFKLVKEKYPHIKTVMGGGIFADQLAVGSRNLDFFLKKTPYIDHIIIGEGEQLFLKLLNGQLPESQRIYTLKDIEYKVMDLNTLDIPDFLDLEVENYPYLASYTSRSCPFQCKFCSETVNWGTYRKKSGSQVARELNRLYHRHGNQLFLMGDSLLNPVITELAHEFLKTEVSLYWDGYLRADSPVCNIENTMLWRRSGLYRARLGLESGSQHVLDLMEKKITVEGIRKAVFSLAYAGIKTTTYWVVGYPGETEEDFQQTLDLVEALKDNIYEAECKPFYYFLAGQVNSSQWAKNNRSLPLYPEEAKDMLILQTWTLDNKPTRKQAYERMRRLMTHCQNLGIPNPYTLKEIYEADLRWQKLHKNAVPFTIDFKNSEIFIDEKNQVKKLNFVSSDMVREDLEFGF